MAKLIKDAVNFHIRGSHVECVQIKLGFNKICYRPAADDE